VRALQLTRTLAGVQHEAGILATLLGTPGASLFWHGRSVLKQRRAVSVNKRAGVDDASLFA
jgi:hypothetical protein